MRNLFNIESPLMQKLTLFSNLILMNAVWLVCCIPIVTIGASCTAMYRVMFDLHEDKNGRLRDFFLYFKENFKKSTLLWLIYLFGGAVLYVLFGLIAWADVSVPVRVILLAPFCLLAFHWFFSQLYVFALCAFFENTLKKTLFNASAISLRHLRQSIICAALTLLPLVLASVSFEWFLRLSFVCLFIYPGFCYYWKSGLISGVFSNYLPDKDAADADPD